MLAKRGFKIEQRKKTNGDYGFSVFIYVTSKTSKDHKVFAFSIETSVFLT